MAYIVALHQDHVITEHATSAVPAGNTAPPDHVKHGSVAPPAHVKHSNVAPPAHKKHGNVAPPAHVKHSNVTPPAHVKHGNVAPPGHGKDGNITSSTHVVSENTTSSNRSVGPSQSNETHDPFIFVSSDTEDGGEIINDHDVKFRVGDMVALFAGRDLKTKRWDLCVIESHHEGYIEVTKYKQNPDGQLLKLPKIHTYKINVVIVSLGKTVDKLSKSVQTKIEKAYSKLLDY